MKAKISIITVVRNAPEALNQTLSALERMDYPNVELIVIDGNSKDSTPGIIEKHSTNLTYWISEPDSGLYDAMNKGIAAATGDYLWFVNAGDFPYDDGVLSEIFGQENEDLADVYYGEVMMLSKEGRELGLRQKRLPEKLSWRSMWRGMVVSHQGFIARREIVPHYDTHYRLASDIDWVIEVLKKAESIQNTHTILCKFPLGGISTQHRKASLFERFTIIRKHFGILPTILFHLYIFATKPFTKKYRKVK